MDSISEKARQPMTTRGIVLAIAPEGPSTELMRGENAASVVRIEKVTGVATWRAPSIAARGPDLPISKWR